MRDGSDGEMQALVYSVHAWAVGALLFRLLGWSTFFQWLLQIHVSCVVQVVIINLTRIFLCSDGVNYLHILRICLKPTVVTCSRMAIQTIHKSAVQAYIMATLVRKWPPCRTIGNYTTQLTLDPFFSVRRFSGNQKAMYKTFMRLF